MFGPHRAAASVVHGAVAVLGGGGIWVVVSLGVVWELVRREGIRQMLNSFRRDILRFALFGHVMFQQT